MLFALLILAGCGGSGHAKVQWETIRSVGFRFQAPGGWSHHTRKGIVTAAQDSELEQVAAFPLAKTYTPTLFAKVQPELMTRMKAVAAQTHGRLTGRDVVTAAGIKSHRFDVTVGDHVDQYTFVLRGKREYQLLCRRKSGDSSQFCERLVASFAVA